MLRIVPVPLPVKLPGMVTVTVLPKTLSLRGGTTKQSDAPCRISFYNILADTAGCFAALAMTVSSVASFFGLVPSVRWEGWYIAGHLCADGWHLCIADPGLKPRATNISPLRGWLGSIQGGGQKSKSAQTIVSPLNSRCVQYFRIFSDAVKPLTPMLPVFQSYPGRVKYQ
jgi:hypothetical protein